MDIFTKEKRSEVMSAIKGKNTKPEMMLRSLLYALGYRYRLHRKDIPGKPDIALIKQKKAIFIHGCYWHRHEGCKKGQSMPSSNIPFWLDKFEKNVARDKRNVKELKKLGWTPITVWECELKNLDKLETKLATKIEKN